MNNGKLRIMRNILTTIFDALVAFVIGAVLLIVLPIFVFIVFSMLGVGT